MELVPASFSAACAAPCHYSWWKNAKMVGRRQDNMKHIFEPQLGHKQVFVQALLQVVGVNKNDLRIA